MLIKSRVVAYLAVVLLSTGFGLFSEALEPGENLLKNPGFEEGQEFWQPTQNWGGIPWAEETVWIDDTIAHTSSNSVRQKHIAGSDMRFWQEVTELDVRTIYTISFWYMSDGSYNSAGAMCGDFSGGWFIEAGSAPSANEWVNHQFEWECEVNSIKLSLRCNVDGTIWYDNIYMGIGPPPEPQEEKAVHSQGKLTITWGQMREIE